MIGLDCECTWLTHVQLNTHQYSQDIFGRAVLHSFIPQLLLVLKCRNKILPLDLLNLMRFIWAHCCSLSWSHWMASRPLGKLITPHNLVSSTNVLRVHLAPCWCYWWSYQRHSSLISIWTLTTTLWAWYCSSLSNGKSTCRMRVFPVWREGCCGYHVKDFTDIQIDDITGSCLVHLCITPW